MREIKFRGKRTDTKEWVYGNLLKLETDYFTDSNDTGFMWYIIPQVTNGSWSKEKLMLKFISPSFEVIPETVGQYTGECIPGCGEMIYEDEIVEQSYINKLSNERVIRRYLIIFEKGHYIAKCIGHSPYGDTLLHFMLANYKYFDTKIAGNKHDNPALLEVQ